MDTIEHLQRLRAILHKTKVAPRGGPAADVMWAAIEVVKILLDERLAK